MELNNSDELAGINTRNITKNQVFQDLFKQLTNIRKYILIYPITFPIIVIQKCFHKLAFIVQSYLPSSIALR